jgi:1,4-dihydroxy-2-naphthoate polyprenyltransferase
MKNPSKIIIWLKQTRANFLLLAVFLNAIGIGLAYKYLPAGSHLFAVDIVLIILGTIAAHTSVNLFNEYSDFRSGIDFHTKRTPFNGGSGMLIQRLTKPGNVLAVAIGTLLFALIIGIYYSFVSHWFLFFIIGIGAFSIVGYTDILAKYLLGELFAGLALGSLVVIGTFIALTGAPSLSITQLVPREVWFLSIPPGILTSLLLFLNEFPDIEADKQGGRNHLLIRFGRHTGSYIYGIGAILTYVIIVILPITGISSYWVYIALIPLPLVVKNIQTTFKYNSDIPNLVPALGGNVITVLATDLLIAGSLLIAILWV